MAMTYRLERKKLLHAHLHMATWVLSIVKRAELLLISKKRKVCHEDYRELIMEETEKEKREMEPLRDAVNFGHKTAEEKKKLLENSQ